MSSMFLEEKKMVYYTLYLGKVNRQKSGWKVRICAGEKAIFQK